MTISRRGKSRVLKIALFATGFSGIVAEYILSTLASYFIGNAILQFTLIVSIMLFSMGLGSRLSKGFTTHVLYYFVLAELCLSVLVSFSAIVSYLVFGITNNSWLVIYLLSIAIGLLIGLEIPFATRINEDYQELRVNISSILEKDYYGSLAGGLFFAFVGLPYLGLTYTPFVLGAINLGVSFWLFWILRGRLSLSRQRILSTLYLIVTVLILAGVFSAQPLVTFGDQAKYKDKVVYTEQTPYQKIVMTQWQGWHSLYINGNQQLSTFDEYLYHEPMAHAAAGLTDNVQNVLILGGGDGCLAREILKYDSVRSITLVDLDPAMTDLGKYNEVWVAANEGAMNSSKLTVHNEDAFSFLEANPDKYDLILTDLPDPKSVDLNKLYTVEFYSLCKRRLQPGGTFITQAGSPYYATLAFYSMEKSMRAAGLNTLPLRNQVLTLGEWGWLIGKSNEVTAADLERVKLDNLKLRWLTTDALEGMTHFGKPLVDTTGVQVNTIFKPKLYTYYKQGNWDLY